MSSTAVVLTIRVLFHYLFPMLALRKHADRIMRPVLVALLVGACPGIPWLSFTYHFTKER